MANKPTDSFLIFFMMLIFLSFHLSAGFCGNSSGGDGTYNACRNDIIHHTPTGIGIEVEGYTDTYCKIELSGSIHRTIILSETVDQKIHLEDGRFITVSYRLIPARGVKINVSSGVTCGDAEGGDGTYHVCKNDTIRHTPSGVNISVVYFDHEVCRVKLSGVVKNKLNLLKNNSRTINLENNSRITITYQQVSVKQARILIASSE